MSRLFYFLALFAACCFSSLAAAQLVSCTEIGAGSRECFQITPISDAEGFCFVSPLPCQSYYEPDVNGLCNCTVGTGDGYVRTTEINSTYSACLPQQNFFYTPVACNTNCAAGPSFVGNDITPTNVDDQTSIDFSQSRGIVFTVNCNSITITKVSFYLRGFTATSSANSSFLLYKLYPNNTVNVANPLMLLGNPNPVPGTQTFTRKFDFVPVFGNPVLPKDRYVLGVGCNGIFNCQFDWMASTDPTDYPFSLNGKTTFEGYVFRFNGFIFNDTVTNLFGLEGSS